MPNQHIWQMNIHTFICGFCEILPRKMMYKILCYINMNKRQQSSHRKRLVYITIFQSLPQLTFIVVKVKTLEFNNLYLYCWLTSHTAFTSCHLILSLSCDDSFNLSARTGSLEWTVRIKPSPRLISVATSGARKLNSRSRTYKTKE